MVFLIFLCFFNVVFASVMPLDQDLDVFLETIKRDVGRNGPTCFISRASEETEEMLQYQATINEGLQRAGIKTYFDLNKGERGLNIGDNIYKYIGNIDTVHFVLCLFTSKYKERSKIEKSGINIEVTHISDRLTEAHKKPGNERYFFLPFLLEKDVDTCVPNILKQRLVADHQTKDLKSIFKDIFTHMYIFYFKTHKVFSERRGESIKCNLEQFFDISLSTHSSLDTETFQTQVSYTLASDSLSLRPYVDEDEDVAGDKISKTSLQESLSPPLLPSLGLISSSEQSRLDVQSQLSISLPASQESQYSVCLISESSFILSQRERGVKRPRSPR